MTSSPLDRRLSEVLVGWGYEPSSRRSLFTRDLGANRVVVYFGRSKYSDTNHTSMSPSFGIVSGRLSRLVPVEGGTRLPEIGVQHWHRSAVFIHDEHLGEEWDALAEHNPSTWADALIDLTDRLLPTLDEHTSDEGLRDCWSTYKDPFLALAEQLAFLMILTAEIGPETTHREASAELRRLLEAEGHELVGYELVAPYLNSLPWA